MRGTTSSFLLAVLLAPAGCRTGDLRGLKLVSSAVRRDGDFYVVTALLRNESPRRVPLDEVLVEMTTYGADGKAITRDRRFSFVSFAGTVAPFAVTRLPLHHRDPRGSIERSRLVLKDQSGRTLSELDVPRN